MLMVFMFSFGDGNWVGLLSLKLELISKVLGLVFDD